MGILEYLLAGLGKDARKTLAKEAAARRRAREEAAAARQIEDELAALKKKVERERG